MSKLIWKYDNKGFMVSKEGIEVDDAYVLQSGETDIRPADNLIPPLQFDGSDWHGISPKDYLAKHKDLSITDELSAAVMQLDQSNARLQTANAQQATQIKQLQQMFMAANQQQAIEKSKEANA